MEKLLMISKFKRPESKKQVRAYLGMLGFFNTFIPAYAELTLKFTDALRQGSDKIRWNEELERAFVCLNKSIAQHATLLAPDYNKEFLLYTDTSYNSIAGALMQEDSNKEIRPVKFVARKLNDCELKYSVTEKESCHSF